MSLSNIFFSSAVFIPPILPAITVTPINPGWDDFSHNYRAKISVFTDSNDDPSWTATAFVIPLHDWEPVRKFSSWIGSLPFVNDPNSKMRTTEPTSSGNPHYVTLLGSESSYGSLSQTFSDRNIRDEILAVLNDVLYMQHAGLYDNERLNALLRSKSFSLGVLRDSSAFRAFHRGALFIAAPSREYIDEAKINFHFSCCLQRHGRTAEIDLSFQYDISTILEDRIHCLIGVNGTGKSRILNEIIYEAARRITGGGQPFDRGDDVLPSKTDSDMPLYNRVIVFSSDAEDRFPRNVDPNSGFEYIYFNLIESERKKSNRSLVKDLIGIVREEQEIDGMSRLSIAKKALMGYVDFNDIYIPMRPEASSILASFSRSPDGKLWIGASLLTSSAEQKRLELTSMVDAGRELIVRSGDSWDSPLSSGQRVYLRFILQLLGSIDTGTLVIMDEPENHLHPSLVCDLMTLLYKALSNTQSIALIATHSAYVVREVPTHCVHILKENDDNDIDVQRVYLKTLGANISQISMAVFGDSTARKYHQLIASHIAKLEPDIELVIRKHAQDLNSEMLSAIRTAIGEAEADDDWSF